MNKTIIALEILKERGPIFLLRLILSKIIIKRINNYASIRELFINKSGLEIGGPSVIFRNNGFVPLYKIVKGLDGCNFSDATIWEGNIESGQTYNYYKNKNGVQFISDATDLSVIPDSEYEFLLSSHCLEHIANPFKAIEEWIRVLKKGGLLFLVVPNKEYCFDHNRPITKFSHLLEDYQNKINETDLTHVNEILELHDLKMDKPAGNMEQFKKRSMKNFENRSLHHHVFDIVLLKEIFNYFRLDVLLTFSDQQFIILGKKL